MKPTFKAYWTSGERTQVAKRKKAAYIESFVKLAVAAWNAYPEKVSIGDYMTLPQRRIFVGECDALGMTSSEFFNHILREGHKAWKAKHDPDGPTWEGHAAA